MEIVLSLSFLPAGPHSMQEGDSMQAIQPRHWVDLNEFIWELLFAPALSVSCVHTLNSQSRGPFYG
ncbi:hypothetical protein EYF80_011232 [Liparis tanakae]|uniref:Uncharacterized protein n=1 Tax=Liparis tanakae TaxID=230148 RepID=A0A4Z2ILJ5_9TELE|nr:hypothetical protein EYF80_011232 [Liparis tanakae]